MQDLTGVKVTVIGVHYAPETTGNAPYTTALTQAISDAGATVQMITGVPHYPQWRVTDPQYQRGLRWRERRGGITLTRVRHFVPAHPNLFGRAGLEVTFFLQSVAAAARDRSDVLIAVTPTLSAVAAAILCRRGRPVGVLVQDLTGASAAESGTASSRVGRLIARAEYWLLKRADHIGVITPRFGAVLAANGIDTDRIVELANFTHVTPVAVSAPEARRQLDWPDRFTVVHTGNIGMKQGLESVVEAARSAAAQQLAVQFVLVGDGNQRGALEDLANGCDNLSFVDPLAEADYPYALAAADVLLVNERPGVREMSLPSKLTSYTVAGRPIIAAVENDGITAETLNRYGSALLCRCGDPEALLAAVAEIAGSAELADRLVDQAALLHRSQYGAVAAFSRYQDFAAALARDSATGLPVEGVGLERGVASPAKVTVLLTMKPPFSETTYVNQLVDGMTDDVEIRYFTWPTAIFGRYDVFHVHWPEFLARPSSGKHNGALKRLLLRFLVFRLQIRKTVVVRTLHNVVPHETTSADSGNAALRKLDALTEGYIRLNPTTPSPGRVLVETIPLGHYIDVFAARPRAEQEVGRILYFGLIRPYKGVDSLIALVRSSARQERLRIVGKPSDIHIAQTIESACTADARISALLKFVTDRELVWEVSRSEIVVLPYRRMHNSAALLVALSLGRIVVAPRTPVNELLELEVGKGWIVMYDGPISWPAIDAGLAAARSRPAGEAPRLEARAWSVIQRRHADLYHFLQQSRSMASDWPDSTAPRAEELAYGDNANFAPAVRPQNPTAPATVRHESLSSIAARA